MSVFFLWTLASKGDFDELIPDSLWDKLGVDVGTNIKLASYSSSCGFADS